MKTWNYSNVVESFSTIVDCNGSLDSGNIIGGYGELNWIYSFRDGLATEYGGNDHKIPVKKLPISINGVETI